VALAAVTEAQVGLKAAGCFPASTQLHFPWFTPWPMATSFPLICNISCACVCFFKLVLIPAAFRPFKRQASNSGMSKFKHSLHWLSPRWIIACHCSWPIF
jgi:hypothetical protein